MKNIVKKYIKYIIALLVIIIATTIGVIYIRSSVETMDYPVFVEKMNEKEIDKANYSIDDDTFTITLKSGEKYEVSNPQTEEFKTTLLENDIKVISGANINWEIVFYAIAFIVMMIFFYVVFGRFYLKNSPVGSTMKNKMYDIDTLPQITFNDVAGNEEAKENLEDIVQFLHDPNSFKKFGAKCPRGVLLYGAPGIGKTLLAKAMAGEAQVPFISISGSEFVEMYVGVGASRVRDLFKLAREKAPCILFIDEIDAIGKMRSDDGSSNEEKDNTLNQLLVELSNLDGTENIVVIGATNRPDILDSAFRSGRFDRQIQLLPPNRQAREAIIKVHLKDKPLSNDVNIERLGRLTIGMTGADIENAINEAAIQAAKLSKKKNSANISLRPNGIEMEDIEKGITKVLVGDDRKTSLFDNEKEREITAWHEAGHALIGVLHGDIVTKATIIPTTKGAGGHTLISPLERAYSTRRDIKNQIKIAFAGRGAEEIRLSTMKIDNPQEEITNGASNDIDKATTLMIKYISVGLDPMYGNINPNILIENGILKSEDLELEIRKLEKKLYQDTKEELSSNEKALKAIANELLLKETLYEDEIRDIINTNTK